MLECNFGGMFLVRGAGVTAGPPPDPYEMTNKGTYNDKGKGEYRDPFDCVAHKVRELRTMGHPDLWRSNLGTVLLGGGLEDGGGAVESFGESGKLGLGAGCVGDVDSLVDAWDDHGSVAGELPWSVDGVLEPWAFGQAGRVEEGLFRGAQSGVEGGRVSRGMFLRGVDRGAGGGEAMRGGQGGGEV